MLKYAFMLFTGILLLGQPMLQGQDLASALELYGQEQYDEADAALRAMLNGTERLKNTDEVYYWLGMIKYRQDAYEQAKALFQQSYDTKSKSPYANAGLGLILMIEANYTEANKHLVDAETYSRLKIPEVVYAISEAYLKGTAPEIGKAKQLLYSRRTEDPADPRTYIMLGDYYKVQGVPELAIQELENAIKLSPNYVPAYTGLAELYYQRGKETRSAEDYQKGYEMVSKALELNPNYAPAYRARAELFLISSASNKYERARQDIEKYLELAGDDLKARVRYIQFLFLTNDYQLVLNEINSIDTVTNVLRRLKGMSHAELGNFDQAKAAMDDYFSNVAEQYTIAADYQVYGDVLRKAGELDKADEYYKTAMSKNPEQYKDLYDKLAGEYQAAAKAIVSEAGDIKKQAKAQEGVATSAFEAANECARNKNEACRDSMKRVMDGAVEQNKVLLAQAESVEAGALKEYAREAYYRQQAIVYADPITLTHYKDLGTAHYNAKEYEAAEAAFKKMSELKADFMLPYTYRFRIAYYLEQVDPEVNDWIAKPVADDVVKAFESNPTGTGLSNADLQSLLLAYEVLALYAFDPEGDNKDYNCAGAKPWIEKAVAIDPQYARIQPVKNYCDEVQNR